MRSGFLSGFQNLDLYKIILSNETQISPPKFSKFQSYTLLFIYRNRLRILVSQDTLNDSLVACSFKTQGVLTNLSRTGLSAGRPKLLFFSREFQGPPGCINYFDIHASPGFAFLWVDPPLLIKIATSSIIGWAKFAKSLKFNKLTP